MKFVSLFCVMIFICVPPSPPHGLLIRLLFLIFFFQEIERKAVGPFIYFSFYLRFSYNQLKRRKDGNPFMDDETLEKQLALEWRDEDLTSASLDKEDEIDDDDEELDILDRLRDDYSEEVWEEIDVDALDEGLDIIEVYDEDGELVGTYTGAEFDKLKRNK